MTVTPEQVAAGQAVYTPRLLNAYDLLVLGISNRFIWRCPTPKLLAHYDRHVSANHLDVGVGTGFFLDRCRFPAASPRIALMDLNANSLAFAAGRIVRYRPETYQRNILEPISGFATNAAKDGTLDSLPPRFDSVGINYLLHCLPGTMSSKAAVFDHLRPLMSPDAVLFGATLLQGGVPRNWAARRLMAFYNRKGVFTNTEDSLEVLDCELRQRFRRVTINVIGCAAVFSASGSVE